MHGIGVAACVRAPDHKKRYHHASSCVTYFSIVRWFVFFFAFEGDFVLAETGAILEYLVTHFTIVLRTISYLQSLRLMQSSKISFIGSCVWDGRKHPRGARPYGHADTKRAWLYCAGWSWNITVFIFTDVIVILHSSLGSLVLSLIAGQNGKLLYSNQGGTSQSCGHLSCLGRIIWCWWHDTDTPAFRIFPKYTSSKISSKFPALFGLLIHCARARFDTFLTISWIHDYWLSEWRFAQNRFSIKAATDFWSGTNSGLKTTFSSTFCVWESFLLSFTQFCRHHHVPCALDYRAPVPRGVR